MVDHLIILLYSYITNKIVCQRVAFFDFFVIIYVKY